MKRHYNITLVESAEGFAVWSDDLPGCCSQGRTRKEAVANIKAAIREYVAAQPEIVRRFGAKVMHEMGQIAKCAGYTPEQFKRLL